MLDAFHLPALPEIPTETRRFGTGTDAVDLRFARLTPALLRRQVDALTEARDRILRERPLREIVQAIDRAAARFADPADPLRQGAEAALPPLTGYSPAMIRRGLDRMATDWRAPRLWELLRAEFGDPEILDRFRPRTGTTGRTRAFGPRLTTHVFSGNVPGVAVTSLVRSLLVKSAALGKTASGEPLLPALFARALAEADPRLGECLAVAHWPGGDRELEEVVLGAADAIIAYGGTEAVESVRARVPPTARFIGYGHRVSFGVVGREALAGSEAERVACAAALDVATFDQQGCVSPHLFYVEEGGDASPREWAARLAAALERLEAELPRGALAPEEASAIHQLRAAAEFAQIAGGGTELHASARGTGWTVIWDPDPAFEASCLNRVVRIKPIPSLEMVAPRVERIGPLLQTVGVAADPERTEALAAVLGALGASRVVPLGAMAWPPPAWHHDGRPPLRSLVRWCDLEE